MKFGSNQVIMDLVRVSKFQLKGGGHFVCHLDFRSSLKMHFELGREFDKAIHIRNLEEIQ